MSKSRGVTPAVEALLAAAEEHWRQYLLVKDAQVLEEVVSRLEEAATAWPEASVLVNLGIALNARHQVLGEPGDLDKATDLFRAAAEAPRGGPARAPRASPWA